MKKILLGLIGFAISLMANEIQAFTSNTMHIELDANTKVEKVFFGTFKEFSEKQNEIMQKEIADLKLGGGYQLAVGATTDALKNAASGLSSNVGLATAGAGVVLAGAIIGTKELIRVSSEDNEYLFLSKAENSKGERTLLFTHLVTNYAVNEEEGTKIALENQIKGFGK